MVLKMLRALLIGALVCAVLVPLPARADHLGGALYVGRVKGGGTVELRMTDSGGKLEFIARKVPADACTFRASARKDIPIQDHSFTSPNFEGTSTSGDDANGTISLREGECRSGRLRWTATRRTAHTLTVKSAGSGGGEMLSTELFGLSCKRTCSRTYADGERVVLKARPDRTSRFDGWSEPCSSARKCVVEMNSDVTVSARFVAIRRLLVFTDGTGSGTVTSSPGGISCPTDCDKSYTKGSTVELTAIPGDGSMFAGWLGACSGTGACSIKLGSEKKVIATFDPEGGGGPGDTDYQGFWSGETGQEHPLELTVLRKSDYVIGEIDIRWTKKGCQFRVDSPIRPGLTIRENGTFSETIDAGPVTFTFSGAFATDSDVSGTLEVKGKGPCKGVDTTWSATKD